MSLNTIKALDKRRIVWFTITGGVCFSLWGLVMLAFRFFGITDAGVIVAFFISGVASGGLLGILLRRNAGLMALLGGIGVLSYIAWLFIISIAVGGFERSDAWPAFLLVHIMWGATIGALLGVAFKNRRVVLALVLAGAIGFPLGMWLASWLQISIVQPLGYINNPFVLWFRYGLTGIIGGAFLGAALSLLEKKKVIQYGYRRKSSSIA